MGVGVGVALCRDFGSRSELPASWMQDPDQWREMDPSLEEVRLLSFTCCAALLGRALGIVCILLLRLRWSKLS